MKTNDWKSLDEARVLVIGHDPKLQNSDTTAEYSLFANYYFSPEPKNKAEKSKQDLAKAVFEQVLYITNNSIKPEQVYVTNLCNSNLPRAPRGKTVLIPEIKAREGIMNIKKIIEDNPTIEYIFPMSQQVNYWLQKLNFYHGVDDFIESSEPIENGTNNIEPFYRAKKGRSFLTVCGNRYKVQNGEQTVIPILHVKNFPLKGRFIAYNECYEKIKQYFMDK